MAESAGKNGRDGSENTESAAEEAKNGELEEGKEVEVEGKRGGRERMTRQRGRGGNIGGEGNRER